jgi:hypothetical protein
VADELPVQLMAQIAAEQAQQSAVELPLPAAPTAEEARAVEAIFAQQEESRQVAGLLGLWTGTLVLHDLAVEHLGPPANEEEREQKKKEKETRS